MSISDKYAIKLIRDIPPKIDNATYRQTVKRVLENCEEAAVGLKLLLLDRSDNKAATQRLISEDEAAEIISRNHSDEPTVAEAKEWIPKWFPNRYDFADSEISTAHMEPTWTMIRIE